MGYDFAIEIYSGLITIVQFPGLLNLILKFDLSQDTHQKYYATTLEQMTL